LDRFGCIQVDIVRAQYRHLASSDLKPMLPQKREHISSLKISVYVASELLRIFKITGTDCVGVYLWQHMDKNFQRKAVHIFFPSSV